MIKRSVIHLSVRASICVLLATGLSGCLFWNHVIPPTPINGTGGDPGADAYEHDIQIEWKFPELDLLNSLKVQYPGSVSVIQTSHTQELSFQLQVFVEKDQHDAYAEEYFEQVQKLSTLSGSDVQVIVPAPSHPCEESRDREGIVRAMKGICPKDLNLVVPATHPLPIDLTVADGAAFHIQNVTGDVKVSGAGPAATLQIADVGNVDLELDAVKSAALKNIKGKIHIAIAHPQSAVVTLDAQPITSFPYDRP